MWRLEKDPYLSSTFGTVMVLDRAPDFDSFRRRMERTALAIPRLRQRVLPRPGQPVATDVGRRPRFRHRPARPAHRLPQAGHLAPGARPRLPDRRRPVRPHAAALAVRRRRRHARRQGGADPEDAPHDHRRRTWGRAVAAVPRLRARCTGAAADRSRHDRTCRGARIRPPADALKELVAGRLRLPIGIAKQVRELLADPTAIPDASNAASQDAAWHRVPALRHRGRPLTALDTTLAAAPRRPVARPVPGHQGRRQASRRHAQHGVPHRRRRRRLGVPHRDGRAGRVAASVDGDLHPHRRLRRQCLHAGAAARADRRDADRRALPRHRRGDQGCSRVDRRRPGSTRWRRSRRRCRPR